MTEDNIRSVLDRLMAYATVLCATVKVMHEILHGETGRKAKDV